MELTKDFLSINLELIVANSLNTSAIGSHVQKFNGFYPTSRRFTLAGQRH